MLKKTISPLPYNIMKIFCPAERVMEISKDQTKQKLKSLFLLQVICLSDTEFTFALTTLFSY